MVPSMSVLMDFDSTLKYWFRIPVHVINQKDAPTPPPSQFNLNRTIRKRVTRGMVRKQLLDEAEVSVI